MKLSLALALTSVAAVQRKEGAATSQGADTIVTNVDGTDMRGVSIIKHRSARKAPTQSDLEELKRAADKRARKGAARLARTTMPQEADTPHDDDT